MKIILIVLSCLILILICRYIMLLRDIKKIKNQLKEINGRKFSNQLVTNPNNFIELNQLIIQLNEDLMLHQEQQIRARHHEYILKEQMTNISHDLRTPLASILGYFELLKDPELTEKERQGYLNHIQRRAKLLQNLINDYYDLARIETTDYSLKLVKTNVNQVLMEMMANFYPDFQEKKLSVTFDGIESVYECVVDLQMLQRVYSNLIENILRYSYQEVQISHGRDQKGSYTKFVNPIRPGEQVETNRVFDRLYTSNKNRNADSTGVGLTVVKALLDKMNQEISCQLTAEGYFELRIDWQNRAD